MNQISPPMRIVLVAVIGIVAVYMLFLRPKPAEVTPVAAAPAAATPVPAKDPGAATASKVTPRRKGRVIAGDSTSLAGRFVQPSCRPSSRDRPPSPECG